MRGVMPTPFVPRLKCTRCMHRRAPIASAIGQCGGNHTGALLHNPSKNLPRGVVCGIIKLPLAWVRAQAKNLLEE